LPQLLLHACPQLLKHADLTRQLKMGGKPGQPLLYAGVATRSQAVVKLLLEALQQRHAATDESMRAVLQVRLGRPC
jgi:hypothetical protein